jgi:class 3 adenylate cyclase
VDVPRTHYARSGELAIAYQVHGSGEHDLLFNGGTASNIETVWRLPGAVRLFERLGRFARVIRYDRRDSGLSDPIKDDLTLEAHAADALAIIDAVGAQRPVLAGSLDGSRSLALLAATRPERVGGLIALAPTARGTASTADPEIAETMAAAVTGIEDFPGAMVAFYVPRTANDPALHDRLTRYIQTSVTPRQAERLLRLSLTSDISEVLPLIQAPTLVLRPRDLAIVSAEASREFADLIPGAEFREIPGDAAFTYELDIDLFADIVEEFVTGTAPAPVTDRVLATVLFTDLVDSTQRAAQAGDRAWAGTLGRHLTDARATVSAHGGETIKTTGDGVLALFSGPAQGVRCAQQIISDARELGLDLRSGLHTGEVERTGDDVAGLAVHLAARIMSVADAGEILVSRTVRDLVIGSELTFADRGEHELKGIPDRWSLYAVG